MTEPLFAGLKVIELRSRRTHYRGPLLICSSLGACKECIEDWGDGPRGVALCIVDVVDCRPATSDDDQAACHPAEGYFAWVLANVRPIEQFPVKGKLSMFDVTLPPAVALPDRAA